MLNKIRKSKITKVLALFIAISFFKDVLYTTEALAITGGPSQPEVQTFEPIGTNQMVDLFSGDFTYNIPLFELPGTNGGYPFNLAYHSGISMDQEASWVGLGWNLNPGAINRAVRGLPDDFKGDVITRKFDMKPNNTFGISFGGNLEIWGMDMAKSAFNLGLSTKFYYNNYKGFGYGFGLSPNYHKSRSTVGIGLGIDVDSQGGAGINPSMTLNAHGAEHNSSFNLGIGIHSNRGLSLSSGVSINENGYVPRFGSRSADKNLANTSSSISFAEKSFNPVVPFETSGLDLTGYLKNGADIFGIFGNYNIGIFWNNQHIKDRGENKYYDSYGYLYLQDPFNGPYDEEYKYLMDFQREKDGLITKDSPNLPIPSLTYDYYNVQGQGIAGMYRPFRTDIGHVGDPYAKSESYSASLGIGLASGKDQHIGVSEAFGETISESGDWSNEINNNNTNGAYNSYLFKDPYRFEGHENVYYKVHGELTSVPTGSYDNIGGEDAVTFDAPAHNAMLNSNLYRGNTNNSNPDLVGSPGNIIGSFNSRVPRNMAIQPLTNEQIGGKYSTSAIINEFDIKYYTNDVYSNEPTTEYNRNIAGRQHHIGGISTLNPDGMRYIYGLPAYNNVKKEYLFSVQATDPCATEVDVPTDLISGEGYKEDDTDEYLSVTTTPGYAHSYLLTSILGADYVDADDIPGPSDGDYGYWIKFNYRKVDNDYQWRAPFRKANYSAGLECTFEDDKGSFVYGTKEVWHVATVETNSHIAEFIIKNDRHDGLGANGEINNSGYDPNSKSYYLEKINIYSKKEYRNPTTTLIPMKTIHFEYDYSLCPNVLNNDGGGNGTGKLTLKQVYFTYQNNIRGKLSPYKFNYGYNPSYNIESYDRWGNYKSGDPCYNKEFPYVDQSGTNNDLYALAWNLDQIELPTGGTINIDYESDDYAYVQHRTATQMFEIKGMGEIFDDEVYNKTDWNDGISTDADDGRIYFKIDGTTPYSDEDFREKYLDPIKYKIGNADVYQLYFKTKMKVRDQVPAFISGYAELDMGTGMYGIETYGGVDYGYVTVKSINPTDKYYHPFAAAGWQFMRTTKPELLTAAGTIDEEEPESDYAKAMKIKSLLSVFNSIKSIFQQYTSHCFNKEWSSEIDLNYSWIRLGTPDKIKYGGGSRVKRISISDNWDNVTAIETNSEYGQVYKYETEDESGNTISSGVASYEPLIGGDENPLRYAKMYPQSIPFKTPNNLYFEYPVNESYFPGPSVGYSKVHVMSLASEKMQNEGGGLSGTGLAIHEFYTCKDFPVIVEETAIDPEPYNLVVPIPFIGSIETHTLTATQGYAIKLNDMHGKQKSVKYYAQNINGGISEEVSGIEYNYKTKQRWYDGYYYVNELENVVNVLIEDKPETNPTTGNYIPNSNGTYDSQTDEKLMGVEYDFFTDMRYSNTDYFHEGTDFNTEVLQLGIPVPAYIPWPSLSQATNTLRTAVTNKIVHKTGILESVKATDGASIVETKNLLWDDVTGRVLLTETENNFDEPIYNYSIPAHKKYDGMAAAYKNLGLEFESTSITSEGDDLYSINSSSNLDLLVPGDELLVDVGNQFVKAAYIRKNVLDKYIFWSETDLSAYSVVDFNVIKSGRKNQLQANVSTIVAKDNPTVEKSYEECISSQTFVSEEPVYQFDFGVDQYINRLIRDINYTIEQYQTGNPDGVGSGNNWIPELYPDVPAECWLSWDINYYWIQPSGMIPGPYVVQLCNTYDHNYTSAAWILDNQSNVVDLITIVSDIDYISDVKEYIYTTDPDIYGFQDGIYVVDIFRKNGLPTLEDYQIRTNCLVCPPILTQVGETPSIEYYDAVMDNFSTNNVINASSFVYSDSWPKENENSYSPYLKGEKGIWKPSKQYVYVEERQQSSIENPSTNVDLSEDGTYDALPIFNWDYADAFPQEGCGEKWKLINETTEITNSGIETESKNILDIYSSALYGYGGALLTAVANNCKKEELGFESFEEIIALSDINQDQMHDCNIDIYKTGATQTLYHNYNIISATNRISDNSIIITDLKYPYINQTEIKDIKVFSISDEFKVYDSGVFQYVVPTENTTKIVIGAELQDAGQNYQDKTAIYLPIGITLYKEDNRPFYGKVGIFTEYQASANNSAFDIVEGVAHTGKQSLKITGSNTFDQKRIQLEKGKNYVFSAWVHCPDLVLNTPTFNGANKTIQVQTTDNIGSTTQNYGGQNSFTGMIIEGWQKVEFNFTADDNLSLIINNTSSPTMYIDDIRIFPFESNIKTYVYNNINHRLMAVLDNNNYATLYYYDEEGNLFLVKKETERGIKTIQESRSHLPETSGL